jgi:hypothetical protein
VNKGEIFNIHRITNLCKILHFIVKKSVICWVLIIHVGFKITICVCSILCSMKSLCLKFKKNQKCLVVSFLIHIWWIRIYKNLAFRICRPWSMKSKFSKVNCGRRSLTEMISNLFESSKSGTCWSVIVCRVFGLLRDVGRAVGHRLDVWHVRCRRGRRYTVLPATPGTQFCLTKENCLWN